MTRLEDKDETEKDFNMIYKWAELDDIDWKKKY